MVPKDGRNLYMAGVDGWVLPERELSTTHTHKHNKEIKAMILLSQLRVLQNCTITVFYRTKLIGMAGKPDGKNQFCN